MIFDGTRRAIPGMHAWQRMCRPSQKPLCSSNSLTLDVHSSDNYVVNSVEISILDLVRGKGGNEKRSSRAVWPFSFEFEIL